MHDGHRTNDHDVQLEEEQLYPCTVHGRLDASAFKPPYTCHQVAHEASTCRNFFVSTGLGTAQLCEWHGDCVPRSVVDCAQPPPPNPPPHPNPPPPTMHDLARGAMAGNVSKLVAVKQMVAIGQTAIRPIVHESAAMVARSTGMQQSQIELMLPIVIALLLSGSVAICVFAPAPTKKRAGRKIDRALVAVAEKGRKLSRQRRDYDEDDISVTARLNPGLVDSRPVL